MDPPVSFTELQREMDERVYRFLLRLRFVLAPMPLLLGGYVLLADPTPWRRAALLVVFSAGAALSVTAEWAVRRGRAPNLDAVLLVVGGLVQPIVFVATGGLLSPVLIAMLLLTFTASSLMRPASSARLVLYQVGTLVLAAVLEYTGLIGSLVPRPFRSVGFPSPTWFWVYLVVTSVFFLVTRELGLRVQQVFAEMLQKTALAREEAVRLHREQMVELTMLTGEIAHELKNPLASVKGLAALLVKRAEGAPPEALVVLRREVDRMQSILEEFLNFSRPLVPLNLGDEDLGALAAEVCTMHEAMAELQHAELALVAEASVPLRCDQRKVKQILINLLQNALDASPVGGRVTLEVRSVDGVAELQIRDEGPGLEPAVAERVFEAGVTTKASGSGLGLNVARGLARQHGGEVTLQSHGEGGALCTLRLPQRFTLAEAAAPRSPSVAQEVS